MADRPIIRDPAIFDGAPHIRGTEHTVAALKAFWRRPGVGAVEMRRQYPDLSESELGAAVSWTGWKPDHEFCAELKGPPHRHFWIAGSVGSWEFAYDNINEAGEGAPGWDIWEATFEEIVRYPEIYGDRAMIWRDVKTRQIVDIYSLSFPEEQ